QHKVLAKCRGSISTGSSRGVGLQLVKEPAKGSSRPATIIATARNPTASTVINIYNLPISGRLALPLHPAAHCLINNAAAGLSMDINTVTPEATMKTFKVNTVAPLFITKVAQSTGTGIHRAAVINISFILGSIAHNWGEGANFKTYAYWTSKAALNMVTRCLAADLGSDGILYMSLHPGWVKTDIGGPHVSILPFPNFKLHL
uniref:C-factor n=1 Tax=Dicentrarchus labrax TaxID=13489 RepID=A0A8C4ER79_DICLA